jgi:hypothetical protein
MQQNTTQYATFIDNLILNKEQKKPGTKDYMQYGTTY